MSLSNGKLDDITDAIHSQPELNGVIIGHYGNGTCSISDTGIPVATAYSQIAVIIEDVDTGDPVSVPTEPVDVGQAPVKITNRSRMWAEFTGAGLTCGCVVLSGVGVAGSAAGEVPSAGTSTFLLVAAWTGLVTSSLQCVNAITRSVVTIRDPDSDSLSVWDQNRIYTVGFLIVDAIGVGAAIVSIGPAVKNLIAVLQRRGGLAATETLAKMGRDARAAEIQRALAKASQNPESRKVLEQALKDAGVSARTIRRVATSSVIAGRNATIINDVIADETARRLSRAILDVVAAVDSPIASAMPSDKVGAASGAVNAAGGVIVHVVGLSSS